MPKSAPQLDLFDTRLVLLHRDGRRLALYKERNESSPDRRYSYVSGTGHSGGEGVYFDEIEGVLRAGLIDGKPICVREIGASRRQEKFLVFSAKISGYELADELRQLPFVPTGVAAPKVPLPEGDLSVEERAVRFAVRETRPEQRAFRLAVFQACDAACVISGCAVDVILEAAHRNGRSWREGHNTAQDGWLLRVDLHKLYDRGLVTIDEAGMVAVARDYPELWSQYGDLDGKRIRPPTA